jgi:hypothetical protein
MLVGAVILVAGSSARALPPELAALGATLERGAATFAVGGDAEKAKLDIRATEVRSRENGDNRVIVRAELLDPKMDPTEAAALLAPALADRTDGPLALARDVYELVIIVEDADRIPLVTYRADAKQLKALRSAVTLDPAKLLELLEELPNPLPTPAP